MAASLFRDKILSESQKQQISYHYWVLCHIPHVNSCEHTPHVKSTIQINFSLNPNVLIHCHKNA